MTSRSAKVSPLAFSCLFLCLVSFLVLLPNQAISYNSEEHKMMGDAGASEVVVDPSIVLPPGTGFLNRSRGDWRTRYTGAKILAAGFATNDPSDYNKDKKGVQDNCYWTGFYRGPYRGGADGNHDYNIEMYVPTPAELTERVLVVDSFTERPEEFTFGELVALYGDYRRTVSCEDGRCYLTNSGFQRMQFEEGTPLYQDYCPEPVSAATYLRHMGSGVVAPFPNGFYIGIGLMVGANTADYDEYDEAAWWGDEMLRIATTNDWHFSSAALAWYAGMHRLALLSVEKALNDPRFWNQALHYEASALHSLTDLFAFGHVVVDRSTTSYNIIDELDLRGTSVYRWMQHVIATGGGVREKDADDWNGRVRLMPDALPSIEERDANRNDFINTELGPGQVGWGNWSRREEGLHTGFNKGGATVINMRGDAFYIYGDGAIEKTDAETRSAIKGAVRESLQSLFDAYMAIREGKTVEEIGSEGSPFFEALNYIPVYVWDDKNSYFKGMWTDYAQAADRLTGTGIRAQESGPCVIPYINGRLAFENTGLLELPPYLPDEIETRSTLCATFPPILSVQVTDGRNTICMGDSVTYSVTVVNRGPQNVAANNVVLVDTLPAGSVFINASSSSGSCDHAGGVVTCNLGTLAFGDSANAIITAAIGSSCEDPVNLAVVAHDETDRDIRDTDTTSVQACVALDIKPGSCRNPVNFQGNYEAGQSVVPAAILGSETFDVRDVDVSSLRLLGVAPVRSSDEDVSGVVGAFTDTCRCFSDGADGHEDLTLKFDKAELIKAMYDYHGHGILPERGDKVILTITGRLRCDAPLVGYDCVVPLHVLWPPPLTTLPSEIDMAESDDDPVKDATPMLRIPDLQNPSEIRFSVPEGTRVRLEVFDIAGRLVSTIDDRWVSPGEHAVSWADGGHASGIYFLRMTTQSHVISRKVVMLH